jgi:hypothetical protein
MKDPKKTKHISPTEHAVPILNLTDALDEFEPNMAIGGSSRDTFAHLKISGHTGAVSF